MKMKRMLLLAAATGCMLGAEADDLPTYSLEIPEISLVGAVDAEQMSDPDVADWLEANAVFVATGGYETYPDGSESANTIVGATEKYSLESSEVGFSWERAKAEYCLADVVEPPEDVDWKATTDLYNQKIADDPANVAGFLLNPDPENPCVYATDGGTHVFTWVLANGEQQEITYTIASVCKGRPKRIYWTDSPYNAPAVPLIGKFVKFFGNPAILELRFGTVTNVVGGTEIEERGKVVSGLYLDEMSQTLYAKGKITGQVIMAYYDSGNFDKILGVQVLEICQPQVIVNKGEIGRALRPNGRGYNIEGLVPQVSAGIGDSVDNRGDYLYVHKGQYSYSPKNGEVYPLRPSVGERWKAEVYWMETDAMKVQWPFEVDQYENDWPADIQRYVRGDKGGDYGSVIEIPSDYTVELGKYQDPEGHALAPDENNRFYTTGAGFSLLKLTGDDNVWFLPIQSVLRSDPALFTLKSERINVGDELTIRGGSYSGLAPGSRAFRATMDAPGYVYGAGTPAGNYDANLYSETNTASSIYAISTAGDIEVWWKEAFLRDDMPVAITVPTLPQVYQPVWPEMDEAPQIVIASQEGSANQVVSCANAAANMDAEDATMRLSDAAYFPGGIGTLSFWMRAYNRNGVLPESGLSGHILTLGRDAGGTGKDVLDISAEFKTQQMRLTVEIFGVTRTFEIDLSQSGPGHWQHCAAVFTKNSCAIYVGARKVGEIPFVTAFSWASIADNFLGVAREGQKAIPGSEIAEVTMFRTVLSDEELQAEAYKIHTGREESVTGYYSFRPGEDLVARTQQMANFELEFLNRVTGQTCSSKNVLLMRPGAPAKVGTVIAADEMPTIYYQNDPKLPGYNPNEEHALVRAGSGGYVVWALRSDLGTDETPPLGVFAEYVSGEKNRLKFFHVVATNETWSALAADCTVGLVLPGPHPIDLFDDPWLAEDWWDKGSNGTIGIAYRDRKKQIWARAAGELGMRMYYAMQEGFYFPKLEASRQPAVGTPIPWMALHEDAFADPLKGDPAKWTWHARWPENVAKMRIGQTLTVAEGGLPEVWNAKSMAIVYPMPGENGDCGVGESPVMLTDPTVMQSVPFKLTVGTSVKKGSDLLSYFGFTIDRSGGLTLKKGKYHFTELPPSLSNRLYVDSTNDKLCFIGERVAKNAGVTILSPNVLSAAERKALEDIMVVDDATKRAQWKALIADLATDVIVPNVLVADPKGGSEVRQLYGAVDHYALTANGGTNYVVLIENDASRKAMVDVVSVTTSKTWKAEAHVGRIFSFEGVKKIFNTSHFLYDDIEKSTVSEETLTTPCPVNEGDPITMRVIQVIPEYYCGRVVTREDEVNLLSQQLSVLYADPLGGRPDNFEFEWKSAAPNPDGTIPNDYDRGYAGRAVKPERGEVAGTDPRYGRGLTRFVVGQQGDTLANMVNTYWTCRYRALPGTKTYETMGDTWSAWCEPPALAEGWVQRVLNNVTPFNQRMTDLYENKAETAVSMIQQAGPPFTGDVALNNDNLTSVGLIQLYETILNKAESMSILLGINDAGANKQLLLAVERLGDLYKVLGDEAYSDAKNPTVSFGSVQNLFPQINFASEASSLFCFDNQVNSLLDEELCLLRGRTGVSAPSCRLGPYYNRLLWNFTKGITAGEVAYAVNYNVGGTETVALSEEQAARTYPQGHGDAYGHYLSALKGWYRLLRNPHFSWGKPAQGEMNVADAAINVDYYEEAKFAEAAADLAKTAADVVDLTARKAWRDQGTSGAGYLDSKDETAFGYGEWASRGAYGALVNWVTANSILPESGMTETTDLNAKLDDKGLMRIDRGTVNELKDICEAAANIMRAEDRLDQGLNPLGLSDGAIPFDIAPTGVSDGSNTHFEQVRDRAKTALANAHTVLERAQTQANRMRLVQDVSEDYAMAIESQEEDWNNQLLEIYGAPYSDDVGPTGTYPQGYEGPDLIHYMWMELDKYGITEVKDTRSERTVYYEDLGTYKNHWYYTITAFGNALQTELIEKHRAYGTLSWEVSASGLVVKPARITGIRSRQGSIQEKYGEFLKNYVAVEQAFRHYDEAVNWLDEALNFATFMTAKSFALFAIKEVVSGLGLAGDLKSKFTRIAINTTRCLQRTDELARDKVIDALPETLGIGMTTVTAPRSIAQAATLVPQTMKEIGYEQTLLAYKTMLEPSTAGIVLKRLAEELQIAATYYAEVKNELNNLRTKAAAVTTAYEELQRTIAALNASIEAYKSEIAKGEQVLAKREQERKRQVNRLSQYRYNEMLFRKIRDKALTRYSAAFDLAQKYVYMAAQVYDYETGLKREEEGAADEFKAKIVATRQLGAFSPNGEPIVADNGDLGLSGYLAQLDANWQVMKPRLGINNPQPYATWFSLRQELFRILPDEAGDAAWAKELAKYWTDDIKTDSEFRRHCQPFVSQFGLQDKEPGLVIPFETTIDFAKNLFGNDLAGGDHAYDSSWYSTRIVAAGVWFENYNRLSADAARGTAQPLSETPVVYLVPVGYDCLRAPGLADGTFWRFSVVDQVIPAPYSIGSYELDDATWMPSITQADWQGIDATVKIRKHPSFRAYFGAAGVPPDDRRLDATRLIGRSVWNTRWLMVIPAGSMSADREHALSVFINGFDANRDGKNDVLPVSDIKIGFRTYSQSGN